MVDSPLREALAGLPQNVIQNAIDALATVDAHLLDPREVARLLWNGEVDSRLLTALLAALSAHLALWEEFCYGIPEVGGERPPKETR
jgi:hypothetical protein